MRAGEGAPLSAIAFGKQLAEQLDDPVATFDAMTDGLQVDVASRIGIDVYKDIDECRELVAAMQSEMRRLGTFVAILARYSLTSAVELGSWLQSPSDKIPVVDELHSPLTYIWHQIIGEAPRDTHGLALTYVLAKEQAIIDRERAVVDA